MNTFKQKFLTFWNTVHLIDKILLILMLLLLLQSTSTLFSTKQVGNEVNAIDIVIRTSAAAIFGYFLSANFTAYNTQQSSYAKSSTSAVSDIKTENNNNTDINTALKNEIGFQANAENQYNQTAITNDSIKQNFSLEDNNTTVGCNKIQVITVSVIGIFSLLLLIFIRNFTDLEAQATATISQLRDFISACVGFLIACGKKDNIKQ